MRRDPNGDCPILRGEHLALEPLVTAHAATLFALLSDSEVWRYTDDKPPESLEALTVRYRRLEARRSPDRSQSWLNWAVVVPELGIVGFVQATIESSSGKAEIAYVIGRRFWSRGLASAAVQVMVRHLCESLAVTQVRATADSRNTASVRLLARLGFALEDDSIPTSTTYLLASGSAGDRE